MIHMCSPMWMNPRSRYPQEVGLTSGYVVPPFPFSVVSVCLPWCTPSASLPKSQTSLVPPE